MASTVLDEFIQRVSDFPDNAAVVSSHGELSYRQLDDASDILCSILLEKGVKAGDIIPLLAERTPELIIGILAVAKSGAAYIPIDTHHPENRISYIIEQSGSSVILGSNELIDKFKDGYATVAIDARPNKKSIAVEQARNSEKSAAYVIFTSGTTGRPKGVVVEHSALMNLIGWHNHKFEVTAASRSTLIAGIGFDVAQWEIWSALTSGSALYLPDEETRLQATALLDYFAGNRISHAFVPTVLVDDVVSAPQPDRLALRYLFTAGEKLNPVDLDGVNYTLVDYYGPTEATIFATYHPVVSATRNPPSTIGRPVADTAILILDEGFAPVSAGQAGELFIAGTCLARGYLNNEQLTAEKFISLERFPGMRLYRSGDLARWLPDGNIQFLGRIDDQVKIRGNRVELGEIESLIMRHADVKTAVALATQPVKLADKKIVVFLVPGKSPGAAPRLIDELKAQLKEMLPSYFLPADYLFIDKLPVNANGKTDKAALLMRYQSSSGARQATPQAYLDPTEREIAAIWEVLLGTHYVSAQDNFFDIGGHSLLASRLVKALATQFGVKTYVRDIYEYPTIGSLAQAIRVRAGGSLPLVDSEPVRALQDDVRLPQDVLIDTQYDPRQVANPAAILLTGATGFVGVHLLADLLAATSAKIYCIVRAASPQQAQQRLNDVMQRYQVVLPAADSARVHVVTGNVAEAGLGLSPEIYQSLSRQIDIVYHSASAVNFIQPYSYMKRDNVQGLGEIIRFAAFRRTKPLVLLSTISVYSWGHLHTGKRVMLEQDDLDQNLPAVVTDIGYVRSKWVMEKMADLAAQQGLPLMVFRLGYATCHSKTGVSASYQWWGRLVKTCIGHGTVPDLRALREGLTTVDYMSGAIAHISRNPQALGKKFNLIHEQDNNLTLKEFFRLLEQHFGFNFKVLPFQEWLAQWEHDSEAPLYPLLSLFKDNMHDGLSTVQLYQDTYQWDCRNAKLFLRGSGIEEPRFSKAELSRYLQQSIGHSPFALQA